jgi:hypothetical protein
MLFTSPSKPPIQYDLRLPPDGVDIRLLNLPRDSNQLDLYQIATAPPVFEMCLWHPRLPWYIHINASTMNGITIADIVVQMHEQLMEPLTNNHFYNALMNASDRESIGEAFEFRTANCHLAVRMKGAVRMDFLGPDVIFLGLAKSKDGMWKMKTKQPGSCAFTSW